MVNEKARPIRDLTVAAPLKPIAFGVLAGWGLSIRDLTVAAPLKPLTYPRPNGRGPIEAGRRRLAGRPIRDLTVAAPLNFAYPPASYPRPNGRGPIEALQEAYPLVAGGLLSAT